jgi:hypothetical protein
VSRVTDFPTGFFAVGTSVECAAGEMVTGGGFFYGLNSGGPIISMSSFPVFNVTFGVWEWGVDLQFANNTTAGEVAVYAICVPGSETTS